MHCKQFSSIQLLESGIQLLMKEIGVSFRFNCSDKWSLIWNVYCCFSTVAVWRLKCFQHFLVYFKSPASTLAILYLLMSYNQRRCNFRTACERLLLVITCCLSDCWCTMLQFIEMWRSSPDLPWETKMLQAPCQNDIHPIQIYSGFLWDKTVFNDTRHLPAVDHFLSCYCHSLDSSSGSSFLQLILQLWLLSG